MALFIPYLLYVFLPHRDISENKEPKTEKEKIIRQNIIISANKRISQSAIIFGFAA